MNYFYEARHPEIDERAERINDGFRLYGLSNRLRIGENFGMMGARCPEDAVIIANMRRPDWASRKDCAMALHALRIGIRLVIGGQSVAEQLRRIYKFYSRGNSEEGKKRAFSHSVNCQKALMKFDIENDFDRTAFEKSIMRMVKAGCCDISAVSLLKLMMSEEVFTDNLLFFP